jgi:flagellar biosynthesis protein FliP
MIVRQVAMRSSIDRPARFTPRCGLAWMAVRLRCAVSAGVLLALVLVSGPTARGQVFEPSYQDSRGDLRLEPRSAPHPPLPLPLPEAWTSPERVQSTLQVVLLMSVVSLAPAILLMTTSFVRIAVVLGLLRQALGAQQLPPNQVITSLALFMTLLLMTPVWTEVYRDAIQPYTDPEVALGWDEAWQAGVQPVRRFMSRQIEIAGNSDDVWLFYQYLPDAQRVEPSSYDEVPLQVLLPAFVLSELKIAFLIGFQIYLPFLILDIVVSSITVSMGMMMLPPTMVSLPLKLMLFVLVDGWNLVVGMLLQSFAPYT